MLARADVPALLVRNKIDLHGGVPGAGEWSGVPAVSVSVREGAGIDVLLEALAGALGGIPEAGGELSARRRHLQALDAAGASIGSALERVAEGQGELAAEDLRAAEDALGAIVGARSTEDLLERIFSSFCIGK